MGCATSAEGNTPNAVPPPPPCPEEFALEAPIKKKRKKKSNEKKRESSGGTDGANTEGSGTPSSLPGSSSTPRAQSRRDEILTASHNSGSNNSDVGAPPSKSSPTWTTTHVARMGDSANSEQEVAKLRRKATKKGKRKKKLVLLQPDIDLSNRSLNHNPLQPNNASLNENPSEQQGALPLPSAGDPMDEDDPRRFSGGSIGHTAATFASSNVPLPQPTLLRSPQTLSLPPQVLQMLQGAHQQQVKLRTAAVLHRSPGSSLSSRPSMSAGSSPTSGSSLLSDSPDVLPVGPSEECIEAGDRFALSERGDGWSDVAGALGLQPPSPVRRFHPLRLHDSGELEGNLPESNQGEGP